MKVVVTGARGFVGQALMPSLARAGWEAEGVGRQVLGSIGPETDWTPHLVGATAVVHLAGMVHVMHEPTPAEIAAFARVNTEGTEKLAYDAAGAGVKRLLYLSTSKVMGDLDSMRPLTEEDPPDPQGPYSHSKLEAEIRLRAISRETGLECVILRPPLVYGPGVKGNLLSLLRLCERPLPLPFKSVDNRRSLISIHNLSDAIVHSLSHPSAAGLTAFVKDASDLSTSDLVSHLRRGMDMPPRLVPIPGSVLSAGLKVVGRREMAIRLLGSFRLDDSLFRNTVDWSPPQFVDEGLAQMARWFSGRERAV